MVVDADVLIHDFTPARAEALSLGFEALQVVNDGLIFTAVTPYGLSGPKAEIPAHELNLCQAGGEGSVLLGGLSKRYSDHLVAEQSAALANRVYAEQDVKEGEFAFKEKRAAHFTGYRA